jgi:hypothetical protein
LHTQFKPLPPLLAQVAELPHCIAAPAALEAVHVFSPQHADSVAPQLVPPAPPQAPVPAAEAHVVVATPVLA